MITCAKPDFNIRGSHHGKVPAVSGGWPFAPAAEPSRPSLRDLCEGAGVVAVTGNDTRVIRGLATDCRRRLEGALYFAGPDGERGDPTGVERAISRGAAAVVTEHPVLAPAGVAVVRVRDARTAMARMAKRFYGGTAQPVELAGVAGRHGKTTVCHWLQQMLGGSGRAALFSGIRHDLGKRMVPSAAVAPNAVEFYAMLEEARENGCRRAVVELSASGLERERWDEAGFTTLVHVNGAGPADFQDDAAWIRLLRKSPPKTAVLNLDDPVGRELIQLLPESVRLVRFGESRHADVRATEVRCSAGETTFRIEWPGGTARMRLPVSGRFQVANFLAAAAAAWAAGESMERALPRMGTCPAIPGRMAAVKAGQPFPVLVDAANTPERLRHALRAARDLVKGDVLVVFGCAGGTNREIRRGMVSAVEEFAGFAWATLDDPGFEAAEKIFSDIRAAVRDPERLVLLEDRRRAIALALDTAGPDDLVLIAGKGHAAFQYVRGALYPFNDAAVAAECLAPPGGAVSVNDAGFLTRTAS